MASSVFLRARGIAFTVVAFISLLWIVLLCLEIFLRWDVSDAEERSFAILLLIVNTITIIMLPLLILTQFRVWLDAARLFFLLMAHIGVAVAYVLWKPKFHCPDQTPDQQGVCLLVNMYILIASWINPGFLLIYAAFLLAVVYRYPRLLGSHSPAAQGDVEKPSVRASALPLQLEAKQQTMTPVYGTRDSSQRMKELLDAVFSDGPPTATISIHDNRKSIGNSSKRDRLSKPVPISYL